MTLPAYLPITLAVALAISALVVYLNERHSFFRGDDFVSPTAKWLSYGWLTALIVLVSLLVVTASNEAPPDERQLSELSFWSLFNFHLILVIFLFGWWAATRMPPLSRFLNIPEKITGEDLLIGVGVGVGGWMLTMLAALTIGAILMSLEWVPKDIKPSPLVPWMGRLPAWQKIVLIFSAMTVEEAFFRGWLQKRVGLILSTVIFALAHAGYGQPLMLIGITVISLLIGFTFYKTRNLVPCIIAHGIFDAIQLFIVVPLALQFL